MRNFQADISWEGPLTAMARSFHLVRGDSPQGPLEGVGMPLLPASSSTDVGSVAQLRQEESEEGEVSWVLDENHPVRPCGCLL